MIKRETLESNEPEATLPMEPLPRGIIWISRKDEECRLAYIGELIQCHGRDFLKPGDQHHFRRIHWKICMTRCWVDEEFWMLCEPLQKFIEDTFDGSPPILRQTMAKEGSAGWLLDHHSQQEEERK